MNARTLATLALTLSFPVFGAPLVGPVWTLVSLQQGNEILRPQAGERYTLILQDSGRVSGVVNCNSCGGAYTVSADSLTVALGFCTDMACMLSDIEGAYSGAISTGGRYVITGDTLRLYGADTLVFATPLLGAYRARAASPVLAVAARTALARRSVVLTANGAVWFDCRGRRTQRVSR
jgi:heat shock protein HslJ